MKSFRLVSQQAVFNGPDILGITRAKKTLAQIVSNEKKEARQRGYTPKAHWSEDRMDCIITLGPDKNHSPMWDRFAMMEVN